FAATVLFPQYLRDSSSVLPREPDAQDPQRHALLGVESFESLVIEVCDRPTHLHITFRPVGFRARTFDGMNAAFGRFPSGEPLLGEMVCEVSRLRIMPAYCQQANTTRKHAE